MDFLKNRNSVRIIGRRSSDIEDRVSTVSFMVEGKDSKAVVEAVDPAKVGIRHGHFYAYRLIDDLGLMDRNGVVRVSMVHYNTLAEVDRLIAALEPTL